MTLPCTSETPPKPERHWRCRLRRLAITCLALYLLIAALLFWFQETLIFPGSLYQGTDRSHVTPNPDEELLTLPTPSGATVAALYSPALTPDGRPLPDATTRPVLLYFYGNGECIEFDRDGLGAFRRMGFNTLIPDYPGYGMSTGRPSATGLYQTADACYAYLTQTRHVPPARIAVMGRSIGGAPAIYTAAHHPVAALATLSAFRTLAEISANTVHHLFPTSLLVRHHLDNLALMPAIHCPTFLAHGTADPLIPFDSAASLARAAPGPTTLYPIPSATHNDVFEIGGQPLFRALATFLHHSFHNTPTTQPTSPS